MFNFKQKDEKTEPQRPKTRGPTLIDVLQILSGARGHDLNWDASSERHAVLAPLARAAQLRASGQIQLLVYL